MSTKLLARLKPYDPTANPPMMQDYTAAPWGIKFRNGIWYEVPSQAAEYLKTVRQAYEDPHSPFAFDVCTEAEAEAIQLREEAAAMGVVHDSQGNPPPLMPELESDPAEAAKLNQPRPKHELTAAAAARAAEAERRVAEERGPAPAPAKTPAAAKASAKAKASSKKPSSKRGKRTGG